MPNGTLKLYNKLTNNLLVSLDILGTFNIEDNLNETPSNMKVKVITSNTYREEFQVNTVAYHEDTNSWWVIKSDESSYLTTGEYEHEIQLVEYLEFYAYRHLPNCAFAPNTYDLEDMLNRLFDIAKLTITVNYPDFLDEDKIMPFFSFENFTVANAIKNISRSINAIPKMVAGFPYQLFTGTITFSNFEPISPSNGDYWFRSVGGNTLFERISGAWVSVTFTSGTITPTIGALSSLRFVNTLTSQLFISSNTWTPTLTFINRNGINTTIRNVLNDQFPIAYEKNMNSNDQFTTRSVSNITNAKSSSLVIAPKSGGFKNITSNSSTYDINNAKVFLPSKIDKVEFLRVYPPIRLQWISSSSTVVNLYEGYYFDREVWRQAIINSTATGYSTALKTTLANLLPQVFPFQQVNYNDPINSAYDPLDTDNGRANLFFNKMSLRDKFEFDTLTTTATKDRTAHWTPNTNELIMPLSFRNGLESLSDHNLEYLLYEPIPFGNEKLWLRTIRRASGFFASKVPNDQVLIQVGYYPIADIKVSIDNDNDAQDEKFFNQSGKVIDAVSVTKLITSHTNDSVEGTKIRNARYESPNYDYTDILPLGQLVRDNNQLYIISQRSIDGHVKNGNEYYNVIYTLSRNRVARSENIVADSAVISYKTPDDNLVNRSQLYKDYIELSLVNNNQEAPYLPMLKALVLNDTLAGTNFDFTVVAKNEYGTSPTTVRYVKNPTAFDLHKAKLMNVNWQSNNLLGFRLDSTGSTYVQTPIVYTDNLGKANNFELLILDSTNLIEAKNSFNFYFPAKASDLIPFEDLTQVDVDFYDSSVLFFNNFSMRIQEDTNGGKPYKKDPFEIPVFEYMIQGNDDYSPNGNIVIGNDLFSTFTGSILYHYTINNTTRFTAENANKLYVAPDDDTDKRVTFTRSGTNDEILDLDIYSTFSGTPNASLIKNIGIYAKMGASVKFLFAINDYVESGINDKSNIRVFINNWKI
jgi:hypothetical protein